MNLSSFLTPIQRHCPDLKVVKIAPLSQGQNSVALIVNDEFVFRFPKHRNALVDLRTEVLITERIAGLVPLPIPVPRWTYLKEGAEVAFVGHKMISGTPLSDSGCQTIRSKSIAAELGEFAIAFHAIPLGVFEGVPLPQRDRPRDWEQWLGEIETVLMARLPSGVARSVTVEAQGLVRRLRGLTYEPTLRHGDFGEGNFLVDGRCQRVTGVIDFGSAALGDPAVDIAGIISSKRLGKPVITYLRQHIVGMDELIQRADLYRRTFPMDEALLGAMGDDPEAVGRGLARFQP